MQTNDSARLPSTRDKGTEGIDAIKCIFLTILIFIVIKEIQKAFKLKPYDISIKSYLKNIISNLNHDFIQYKEDSQLANRRNKLELCFYLMRLSFFYNL